MLPFFPILYITEQHPLATYWALLDTEVFADPKPVTFSAHLLMMSVSNQFDGIQIGAFPSVSKFEKEKLNCP
jgi:hypothetical protein